MTTLLVASPIVNLASKAIRGPHSSRSGPDCPPVNGHLAVHEAAIADIVGMIRTKYSEDGQRSFAIGQRAFEHAQWMRGNFPSYQPTDFDALMKRIRDEVRVHVPIKAESIRVSDWTRCHVLRELVRGQIADHADALSMFEYRAIVGKALAFSTKDVEGSLNLGWLDMIRDVAATRATGGRVTRSDFEARVVATVNRIAEIKAASDPSGARVSPEAVKARKRAAAKARESVTALLSDGIAGDHISANEVVAIVETIAKEHGKPLPSTVGFDPAGCNDSDCDLLAATMFQAGKYSEMVRLRDRLDRMVESVDQARVSSRTSFDRTIV